MKYKCIKVGLCVLLTCVSLSSLSIGIFIFIEPSTNINAKEICGNVSYSITDFYARDIVYFNLTIKSCYVLEINLTCHNIHISDFNSYDDALNYENTNKNPYEYVYIDKENICYYYQDGTNKTIGIFIISLSILFIIMIVVCISKEIKKTRYVIINVHQEDYESMYVKPPDYYI